MSAQRPLTAEAARWQPVQQATGRGRWVQGPAGQRSGEAVPRRQPPPGRCDTIPLGNRAAGKESSHARARVDLGAGLDRRAGCGGDRRAAGRPTPLSPPDLAGHGRCFGSASAARPPGRCRRAIAHRRPDWPARPWEEQTCRRSPPTPSRSGQRVDPRRPGGIARPPGPAAAGWPSPPTGRPPASHRAPREGAQPGLGTAGSRVGDASAANDRRHGGGPAHRWGPSPVPRAGRPG
jgi:hypothetical protein